MRIRGFYLLDDISDLIIYERQTDSMPQTTKQDRLIAVKEDVGEWSLWYEMNNEFVTSQQTRIGTADGRSDAKFQLARLADDYR